MPQADPFAVIRTETPALPEGEILQMLQRHYGLEARLAVLVSERDQNFRLHCDDGRQFVLKITNAAEDPRATDFQVRALEHLDSYLASHDCPINVPRILPTTDGSPTVVVSSGGRQHIARVVSYLAGVPLDTTQASPLLCRRLGTYLAHLGRALRGFDHPGSGHGLLWDMQQASALRRIIGHVADQVLQQVIMQTLDDFETFALPCFDELRSQVIHSDFNPDNILIDAADSSSVAGVIDFGDMLKAPLIVDVAIGGSYLWRLEGNPLAAIAEFLAGYHSVTPLDIAEIDLLFDLIKTRLAASITILSWRATLRGADDPYLAGTVPAEGDAAKFLERLHELPREATRQTFRQICASAGV